MTFGSCRGLGISQACSRIVSVAEVEGGTWPLQSTANHGCEIRSSAHNVRVNACRKQAARWLSREPVAAHQGRQRAKARCRNGSGPVGRRRLELRKLRCWCIACGKGSGGSQRGRFIGLDGGRDRGRQQIHLASAHTRSNRPRCVLAFEPELRRTRSWLQLVRAASTALPSGAAMPATASRCRRGQPAPLPHKRVGRGVSRSRRSRRRKAAVQIPHDSSDARYYWSVAEVGDRHLLVVLRFAFGRTNPTSSFLGHSTYALIGGFAPGRGQGV